MKKIRVFLIEDNRILLDGLSKLVDRQNDMLLIGTAGGGDNILSKVGKAKPQIVLIDSIVEGRNGSLTAKMLKAEFPDVKLIGMGLSPSGTDIADFVKGGATGYIMKDAGASDVLETIRWVARETMVILPFVPDALFTRDETPPPAAGNEMDDRNAGVLTKREQEIVQLIADSSSNKEIARRLNIATFTVKSHVHNILVRLGLHSRLQIAKYALVSQFLPEPAPVEGRRPALVALNDAQNGDFRNKYRNLIGRRQNKYAVT